MSSSSEAQIPAGHRSEPIPGYHLQKRIGAGGYGEVWSAQAPGELIKAIKFVYGFLDQDRASRELKALNRIKGVRHPFLLSLERIEVVDGQLVIVTELADGSLKDRFEECIKNGQVGIPRKELLAHLHDAADALDYMNAQHSLQHLDVKPENLLLVGGRIKVADFGLVKDMQDTSASLMGGLTPIYAPPEVFDARPSRRSDQYSLAIVFQEMLTGVVPFPGKSAAQLAVQHLNAKPRLSTLPAGDQPIIGRALAKDPAQRFGSCVELVEALLHAVSEDPAKKGPGPSHASSLPNLGATSFGTQAFGNQSPAPPFHTASMNAQPLGQETIGRLDAVAQAAQQLSDGNYVQAEAAALCATVQRPLAPVPAASLVDLPPLDVDLAANHLSQTLFLGIGGLAGKTMQQLRRRFEDRCDVKQRGRFHFLLFDTDSQEIMEATHGQAGSPIQAHETLLLPLRKSSDYRNDSRKYLDWLSRRWLFNIPKSQQTEGIRPFGRLAFADHGEEAMQRLRDAVTRILEAGEGAGDAIPPRIVVLASSSGGTASGMVLDVAFAARQLLEERCKEGQVELILLHGTSRQPVAQELAAVNAFALLTELNHYLRPGGIFPDDPSIGLKSRSADARALDSAYLIHLGQELGPEQFLAASDRVAEYLYLDGATPTGAYLRACRAAEPHEKRADVTLRTFGLCPVGFSDSVVASGAEKLCQAVLRRWSGEPKPQVVKTSLSERLVSEAATAAARAEEARNAELDQLAATQAQKLGLELDVLIEGLNGLAVEELGGDPDVVFRKIVRPAGTSPLPLPPVEKWLDDIACFFGPRFSDLDPPPPSPLHNALLQRLPKAVAPLGQQIRDWLLALPEDPAARVSGAHRCVKWFQTHLKSIGERAKETRAQMGGQIAGIEQRLAMAARTPARASRNKDGPTLAESLFLQHCQFRIYQLAAQVASQLAQNLLGYVSQASDQLHDLTRDLKQMTGQFKPVEVVTGSDDLERLALAQLEKDEDEAALRVDQYFQQQLFASAGFRTTLLQGGEKRHELMTLLRKQARQTVLSSLGQIDLTALVLQLGDAAASGTSQLAERISDAQPWLQQVGGERRLVCVAGKSGENQLSPEALSSLLKAASFEQLPAVIPATASQVVFCFEIGNIPLAHVASRLIDQQPHYAQAASRLHARSDVVWQELAAEEA